jgi:predicted NUDIX family NTP pyrophosphohydrolase
MRRADAGALLAVQPGGEVRRPDRLRARAWRRLPRHRPLCPARRERGRVELHKGADPRATRAISSTARRATSSISCASRSATCPRARCGGSPPELGLEVAAKPDSQDICFVPDGDYAGLVKRCGPKPRRRARSSTSTAGCSGEHRGVVHFTIGQRRGIEIGGQKPSRSTSSASSPRSGGSSSARAARWRSRRCASRTGTGSARTSARSASRCARWRRRCRRATASGSLRRARIWRRAGPGGGVLRRRRGCSAAAGSPRLSRGPFWRNKDAGAWMIPKGMVEPGEAPAEAALREFEEETGTKLTSCRSRSRRCGRPAARSSRPSRRGRSRPAPIKSNEFEVEWPPRSGRASASPKSPRRAG